MVGKDVQGLVLKPFQDIDSPLTSTIRNKPHCPASAARLTFKTLARISSRVTLINGMRLTGLMEEHGTGLRASRVVEFKRLDEGIFPQEDGLAL